jgi:hypothetical protein
MSLDTPKGIYDSLLAGVPAAELQEHVQSLPTDRRQTLLCVTCWTCDEIEANCTARAAEAREILSRNCPFYQSGVRTCLQPNALEAATAP